MDKELQTILDRQREIAAQIERLRVEAEELDTAVRVIKRYAKAGDDAEKGQKLGPPRPEGLPSLFEMTAAVLRDATDAGKPGLSGFEIVTAIGRRYWPGVKPQQILPPIYGFKQRGKLRKSAKGVFSLPE